MRKLVDMDHRKEMNYVDWEFIYDMQGIAPDKVTPELLVLDRDFLGKVPDKWQSLKRKLAEALKDRERVHIAIFDVEKEGNDFKVTGAFKKKQGDPLGFHKIIVMDEDYFEDDYIGTTISDKQGQFKLSFDEETFADFRLIKKSQMPDIYFKIFEWRENKFHEIAKIQPEPLKVIEYKDKKKIIDFGVIEI